MTPACRPPRPRPDLGKRNLNLVLFPAYAPSARVYYRTALCLHHQMILPSQAHVRAPRKKEFRPSSTIPSLCLVLPHPRSYKFEQFVARRRQRDEARRGRGRSGRPLATAVNVGTSSGTKYFKTKTEVDPLNSAFLRLDRQSQPHVLSDISACVYEYV